MQAVSDWPCGISGHILSRSGPISSDAIARRRAYIQLTLPRTVLISPLWREEPVRVRQPPGREGVGREALMHQRQRRLGQRVAQVLVEAADLRRQQQALVDHRAGREGRHVELASGPAACAASASVARRVQDLLADRQDLALEGVLVARSSGWRRRSPGGSPASSRSPRRRGRSCRSARRASRSASGPRRATKCSNMLDGDSRAPSSSCGRKHIATA